MTLALRVLGLVLLGVLGSIARTASVSADDFGAADLTIRVGRSANVRTSLAPEPSWRGEFRASPLTFDGTVATAHAGPRLGWVLLDGGLELWRARGFGMGVIGGATHEPAVNPGASDHLRTQAILTWSSRYLGLWLSGAAARPFGGTHLGDLWAQGGGILFRKGAVSVAGSIDHTMTRLREQTMERVEYSPIDSISPRYEAVSRERDVPSTEVRLTVNVTQTRLELNPTAGVFHVPTHGARGWIRTDASYWFLTRFALAARVSSATFSAGDVRSTDGLSFTLGARFAPWRRPSRIPPPHDERQIQHWEVQRNSEGRRIVRLVAPGARSVDLRGDLTGWKAVPLEREDGESWHVELEAAPGPHYVLVRCDHGPWVLLPGAPAQEDGYRGIVSVLIFD